MKHSYISAGPGIDTQTGTTDYYNPLHMRTEVNNEMKVMAKILAWLIMVLSEGGVGIFQGMLELVFSCTQISRQHK